MPKYVPAIRKFLYSEYKIGALTGASETVVLAGCHSIVKGGKLFESSDQNALCAYLGAYYRFHKYE